MSPQSNPNSRPIKCAFFDCLALLADEPSPRQCHSEVSVYHTTHNCFLLSVRLDLVLELAAQAIKQFHPLNQPEPLHDLLALPAKCFKDAA